MLGELAAIQRMTVGELQATWRELYGEECRSRNRIYLVKRLCWRIQEIAHGGLSDRAKTRINELTPDSFTLSRTPREALDTAVAANKMKSADPVPGPKRDPRLPTPGTVITRIYHGRELQLLVLEDGFELDGVHYRSLSEAARAVTGSKWNGRLFWQLTQRKRKS